MELLNKKVSGHLSYIKILFAMLMSMIAVSISAQNVGYNLQESLHIKNADLNSRNDNSGYSYFESESQNGNTGRFVVTLNTLNQEKITVSWQNSFTKKTNTKWFVRLQYRLNENEEWRDVKDKRGHNIEFATSKKLYSKTFSDVVLPSVAEDKEFVQIAWYINSYSSVKGNYPDIHIRNITVTSDYDKYMGKRAEVSVYGSSDEDKQPLQSITFDKIPLPYVYPGTRRIIIEGDNIRDSITLRIVGADASSFTVSQTSLSAKQALSKGISVNYVPKKEGRHRAELVINTHKMLQPIEIPLEGVCAKHVPLQENMLPRQTSFDKNFTYYIPVFSNTDYEYRFSQNDASVRRVEVTYKWYRNDEVLDIFSQTAKQKNYTQSLKSPSGATALSIDLSADGKIVFDDYYFGSPKVKTMVSSGAWSDDDNWEPKGVPGFEDFVVVAKNVRAKVDKDVVCGMLILDEGANVSINTGRTFYVSSDIFYNKDSWFTVHQYLLPSRWNYISSPVNNARAAIFSMSNNAADNDTWFMQYNTGKKSKMDDFWSDYITNPEFSLVPGKGYAVYTHDAMDVRYEGLLCSSSVTVPLVTTREDRWNLIGNPYTAPLSSKKLFEDIDGRIQGNAIMLFDRQSKVYNPLIIDPKEEVMIPSLESFFVEALDEPTEITFKRTHQYIPDTESDKTWTNNNYLNLSVCKDAYWQYVLLGMDPQSDYGFDEFDCHKMFGNNEDMPDIYLLKDGEEFSVNVFPDYPAVYDIGLYIGNPSTAEINLNNLSIMPDYVQIFIEDKESGRFYDYCSTQDVIRTNLKAGTTEKYRIHILRSEKLSEINDTLTGIYVWHDDARILFYSNMTLDTDKIRITKNSETISEEDYVGKDVFGFTVKGKGKYVVSCLIDNEWIEVKKFDI